MKLKLFIFVVFLGMNAWSQKEQTTKNTMETKKEIATLANGCFWCTEAIFQRLKGVQSVTSGFTGGNVKNPAYREVVTGRTGHAEAIQIEYDPDVLTFAELLEVFFSTHDPTTLNRQGYDVGTMYRSGIFYHSDEQKELAEQFIEVLDGAKVYDNPIVTEVTAFDAFYEAENYHQDYYNNNKNQQYCVAVIRPKLNKFLKDFKDKVKKK